MKAVVIVVLVALLVGLGWYATRSGENAVGVQGNGTAPASADTDALMAAPEVAATPPSTGPLQRPRATEVPPVITNYRELMQAMEASGCEEPGGELGTILAAQRERGLRNSMDFAVAFGAQPPADAYQAYDTETLTSLANSGDARAELIRGHRAMAEDDLEAAQAAYRQATLLGDVDAPAFMLWLLGKERKEAEKSGDQDAVRRAVVQQLSWHRLQEQRNGFLYFPATERWAQRYLDEEPGLEGEATALSSEIYQTMADERQTLGMEDFDNTPSTLSANDFFDAAECQPAS